MLVPFLMPLSVGRSLGLYFFLRFDGIVTFLPQCWHFFVLPGMPTTWVPHLQTFTRQPFLRAMIFSCIQPRSVRRRSTLLGPLSG
jgi:hypothetical protein